MKQDHRHALCPTSYLELQECYMLTPIPSQQKWPQVKYNRGEILRLSQVACILKFLVVQDSSVKMLQVLNHQRFLNLKGTWRQSEEDSMDVERLIVLDEEYDVCPSWIWPQRTDINMSSWDCMDDFTNSEAFQQRP